MIKKGFTLIEALVAILILGLVATLVIPTLASNIRKQTYASALSNAITTFESAMEANMLKRNINLFKNRVKNVIDVQLGIIDDIDNNDF